MDLWTDISKKNGSIGVGIYTNDNEQLVGTITTTDDMDTVEAEIFGILEAIRRARNNNYYDITIHTDCDPAAHVLRGEANLKEKWKPYMESYEWLTKPMRRVVIKSVNRSENNMAHDLARQAVHQ